MNEIDQLDAAFRSADPSLGIDRNPDSPAAQRLYQEARYRAHGESGGLRREPGRPPVSRGFRQRSFVFVAILAVAAAVVVVPELLPGGTPAYAIRRLPSGLVVIDWSMDNFAPNADAMAADLRSYGVDVMITTIPSSPSEVGHVDATFKGALPEGLTLGKVGTPGVFTWTFDPAVFHGPVTLEVSVPASAGEHYQIANSVFSPGEVLGGLQCALGQPLRAADVAARLPDLGLTAVWQVSSLVSSDSTGSNWQNTQVGQVPDGFIGEGYSLNDTTVEFTVVSDRAALEKFQGGSPLSDVPCTTGQTAAWK